MSWPPRPSDSYTMSTSAPTQLTAPNLYVEAGNGITHAYRHFGTSGPERAPLLFLQHFRGNLDNWDPLLIDAIAAEREVILLGNTGVGATPGRTPSSVTAMAHDALAFTDALGLRTLDILGFSLGGFVAQELTLIRPQLVRRLVLAGTGPQGGKQMHGFPSDVLEAATPDESTGEDFVHLFFERTPTSVGKGWEFVDRIFARTDDRDEPTSLQTRDAQLDAIIRLGDPRPDPPAPARRDRTSHTGGERRPRRPHTDEEQQATGIEPAQRRTVDLPGCRARLPLPAADGVRGGGQCLPGLRSKSSFQVHMAGGIHGWPMYGAGTQLNPVCSART